MSKAVKTVAILLACLLIAGWLFDPVRLPILGYPGEKEARLPQFHYSYDALSARQQSIYRRILCDLRDYRQQLAVFPHLTAPEDVELAMTAVLADNPQLFWVQTAWSFGGVVLLGGLTGIYRCEYNYAELSSEVDSMQAQIDAAISGFISGAETLGSDYEKAVAAHNYIIKNTSYAVGYTADSAGYDDVSSIYSVFVGGRALCSGYAKAYQYLLDRLGVECAYISGTADGDSHSWNLVKLDGEYYFVDVTWDDPVYSDGHSGMRFDYFCIPSAELAKDHTAEDFPPLPVCSDYSHWIG